MTTWQVLKWHDHETADNVIHDTWVDVGTTESETSFYVGHDAPQRVGETYGNGSYLLLNDDGRYARLRIGVREEFYEIEAEPDTSEAIMEREG